MFITIYIHNKPLYLADSLTGFLETLHRQPDTLFINELNDDTVNNMLRDIQLPGIASGIFLHKNLQELEKAFSKKFKVHIAGGGLVTNETGEILMIYRRGFWDLPKGHLDSGETIEECALREVREETGLTRLQLLKPLTTTYHTYVQGVDHILKESHWYVMKAEEYEALTPQTEEDIERIEWVNLDSLEEYSLKAYPSIVDVLSAYKNNNIAQTG